MPTEQEQERDADAPHGAEGAATMPAHKPQSLPVKERDTGAEHRRKAFVRAYMANGNNATQAAIAAGYSVETAGTQGWRLLKDERVRALIDAENAAIEGRNAITADFVLGRLKAEAMGAESDAARVAALNLLAKHLGLFAPEQHNHQFSGTLFALAGQKPDDGDE